MSDLTYSGKSRHQRARDLVAMVQKGADSYGITLDPETEERIKRGYKLWAETWVLPELTRLLAKDLVRNKAGEKRYTDGKGRRIVSIGYESACKSINYKKHRDVAIRSYDLSSLPRDMKALVYKDFWNTEGRHATNNATLRIEFSGLPTPDQIADAAALLISRSGDYHHCFIESFYPTLEPGVYELSTGS